MAVQWEPLMAVLMTIMSGINAWEVKQIIDFKERLAEEGI